MFSPNCKVRKGAVLSQRGKKSLISFEKMLRTSMLVQFARDLGNDPHIRLKLKLKYKILVRFPKHDGMGPLSLLSTKDKFSKELI